MNNLGMSSIAANQHMKEKKYWMDKFNCDFVKNIIPYDFQHTNKQDMKVFELEIKNDMYDSLKKLCNGSHARTYIVFNALINLILHKYSGESSITIGTTILAQEKEENFINTVVALRNNLDKNSSFKDLLQSVRHTITEALENQNYPLNSLIYQLGMEEEKVGYCPLFDVVVLSEQIHKKEYLKFNRTNIVILINDCDKFLRVKIEYNSCLYSQYRIERLAAHMRNALKDVLENIDKKISEVCIIDQEEKNLILNTFNKKSIDFSLYENDTIYSLFQKQVLKTPDNIAVQFKQYSLTYAQLDHRAGQLADILLAYKENSKSDINIVGIFTYRSLEMIIAMVGILKSGMAYLPIDPEYPNDRVQYIIENSNLKILVTNSEVNEDINFNGIVVNLNQLNSEDSVYTSQNSNLSPENLAYIIYTSGSTGQPKGVKIKNKAILNTLMWRKKYYNFCEEDVVLQIPTYTFDSSVEDIFTSLISGAKLIILEQENRFNISYIQDVMFKNAVTHFLITPALYKVLLEETSECLTKLRVVTIAGDNFSEFLIKSHFEKLGNVRLINEYGPTENSVCSTVYEFTKGNTKVIIGKPIDNVSCFILDKDYNVCPVGIFGELCLSGNGLAEGYLNNEELSDEKFVDCPFIKEKRMYKTGDLVRWLSDGNIEFLGRKDLQVKIRGFRIELGEIEQVLLKFDSITDTIVLAKEDKDGNKYLVQYFCADKKYVILKLREKLREILPEHMIPSYFVQLDRMPLTANGKIDRLELAKIQEKNYLKEDFIKPESDIEIALFNMWSEILETDNISIHSNFFEIGGHSLRASSLVAKIKKHFNIDMPLNLVFEKPSIYQLAEYISGCKPCIYIPLTKSPERKYYSASSAQNRIYLLSKSKEIGVTYNVPLKMEIDGILDKKICEAALKILIKRHDSLRTSFEYLEEGLVQRIHEEVEFRLDYVEASERELGEIEKEFVEKFDLRYAPLFRATLIIVNNTQSILMFDMHHIISDGVSMNILLGEFADIYEGKELTELKFQYKDYAIWQQKYLQSESVKNQIHYWENIFSIEPPVLNMQTDFPRPYKNSFHGNKVRTVIDSQTTEKLMELAVRSGTTMYIVLLSAFHILLSKYTGQEDIVVGSPIAGRTNDDINNIIGIFINMIALRTKPVGNKRYSEYLKEVNKVAIGAITNQDCQFNDVIKNLKIDRNVDRKPLFDTMFALQNIDNKKQSIMHMNYTMKDIDVPISKFDLSLIAVERQDNMELIFEYCTDLFKEESILRLSRHFINLLKYLTANEEIHLKDIQLMDKSEKNQILKVFNHSEVEFSKNRSIVQLFEKQAEERADNVALVFNEKSINYKDLNKESNKVAWMLKEKYGIRENDVVGIISENSFEMIAGVIGTLKNNAAYLPIDLKCPKERVYHMIKETKAKVLLVYGKEARFVMPEDNLIPVENIDLTAYSSYNTENIGSPFDINKLVYIIYTSGSTGLPKGVMVSHKALLNLCFWHNNQFLVTERDRTAKYANFGFDASVWEIFPYLIAGATLYLVNDEMKLDVVKLNKFYNENNITISFLPTQICSQFLELENQSLRILLTGGDKLNYFVPHQYKLFNNYGPTENTVVSTSCIVKKDYINIPIGKPIANTQILILDKNNSLQPVGIPGEICISGESMALGYINSQELTDLKFKPHPYDKNRRLYYSGDIGKWDAEGNIYFLGRMDGQIKIRGNRVEVGEIEYRLLKHENINEAVVVPKGEDEKKIIVAYIVTNCELESEDVKEFLIKSLPRYMIPATFIKVDKIPLTKNGKADKAALLQLKLEKVEVISRVSTETEIKLMKIWREVIETNEIGNRDNFFDIGGNSLLIMKVTNLIYQRFNMKEEDLSVMSMFEYPTIETMATHLDGILGKNDSTFMQISERIKKRKKQY